MITDLFPGDGRAAAALRAVDWDSSPLGPVPGWPAELLAAIRTLMPSAVPQLIWWGPELVQIYNEAYVALLGDKHPSAAGKPAADSWAEIWQDVGPMANSVASGRGAMFAEDLLLLVERKGFVEETYWTFSYSPITDASGSVLGIYVATRDTTDRVVNARRTSTLGGLGSVSAADEGSVRAAAEALVEVLSGNRGAAPSAVLYVIDDAGTTLSPAAWYGIGDAVPGAVEVSSGDLLAAAFVSGDTMLCEDLAQWDFAAALDQSPLGAKHPDRAVAIPLRLARGRESVGVLWLATNPYRELDSRYRTFLDLVGRQVTSVLTDAIAHDRGHRKVELLTELDEIKTRFFQNVSHEFRTPLTLMLGPLAEARESADGLSEENRDRVETAHRAALRLQRLVDALLQFARADAHRLTADAVATDLAAFTTELAAMFRSTAQAAGLELTVDTSAAPSTVLIDPDIWSNIVLNLLSNAVKFTEQGSVRLTLSHADGCVELAVTDTGIGIPVAEQQKVFERFHQVRNAATRGGEGAGIGLSLVSDLVSSLGGRVDLLSAPGRGSTFTVRLPLARAADAEVKVSRPPQQTAAALINATQAGRVEASEIEPSLLPRRDADQPFGRVMLVEDDPDMRAYLSRILSEDGWIVDAAADVVAALSTATAPDLVLSDIMLPGTTGVEFVRLLRADPALSRLPVILLTAQAGPESAAEGLLAGADDFVVKPFDPRELLARVRVHRELAALRDYALRQAEEKAASLQVALRTNREIGTAIGILMSSHRINAEEAFGMLRAASQNQHRKLRDIADEVNLTGALVYEPGIGTG